MFWVDSILLSDLVFFWQKTNKKKNLFLVFLWLQLGDSPVVTKLWRSHVSLDMQPILAARKLPIVTNNINDDAAVWRET